MPRNNMAETTISVKGHLQNLKVPGTILKNQQVPSPPVPSSDDSGRAAKISPPASLQKAVKPVRNKGITMLLMFLLHILQESATCSNIILPSATKMRQNATVQMMPGCSNDAPWCHGMFSFTDLEITMSGPEPVMPSQPFETP